MILSEYGFFSPAARIGSKSNREEIEMERDTKWVLYDKEDNDEILLEASSRGELIEKLHCVLLRRGLKVSMLPIEISTN